MKISDTRGSLLTEINGQKGRNSKANGTFQKVMSETLQRETGKSAQPLSVNSLEFSSDIRPAQMIRGVEAPDGIFPGTQVMRELQSTLDLAGFYTTKLGDPAIKTPSLEPLVSHLEEKLEGLRSLKEEAGLDEELKGIVSELDLALGTEVARFRRGDYY
jgi:hypothetical protein